eukprot:gene2198-19809_t
MEVTIDGVPAGGRVYPRTCTFFADGRDGEQPDASACMIAVYHVLPTEPRGAVQKDKYTDGRYVTCASPGRSHGVGDVEGLRLVRSWRTDEGAAVLKVDPTDINQAGVGDCWLLSAVSALCEFPDAVAMLFRKTQGWRRRPAAGGEWNTYTVTLYDLRTWTEVDIEVDERLVCNEPESEEGCASPSWARGQRRLLGSPPSPNGQLWPCYIDGSVKDANSNLARHLPT